MKKIFNPIPGILYDTCVLLALQVNSAAVIQMQFCHPLYVEENVAVYQKVNKYLPDSVNPASDMLRLFFAYSYPYVDQSLFSAYLETSLTSENSKQDISILLDEYLKPDAFLPWAFSYYFPEATYTTDFEAIFELLSKSDFKSDLQTNILALFSKSASYLEAFKSDFKATFDAVSAYHSSHRTRIMKLLSDIKWSTLPRELEEHYHYKLDSSKVVDISFCLFRTSYIRCMEDNQVILGANYQSVLIVYQPAKPLAAFAAAYNNVQRQAMVEYIKQCPTVSNKMIADHLSMSISTVSRYLDILFQTGMLIRNRKGKTYYYSLNEYYFEMLREYLNRFISE